MKHRLRPGATLLGLVCAASVFGPLAASAQTVETLVVERRREYVAARDAWEAARSALSVLEGQFSSALEAVSRAKRTNDQDALERALAVAQDRSLPLQAQTQRVEDAYQSFQAGRQRLVNVITVRLEQLVGAAETASSAARRNEINRLIRDLSNELRGLEREAGEEVRLNPVVLPDISHDPRDLPEEREIKAQLLERRAAIADTVIAQVDAEIAGLQDRARLLRNVGDFVAGTERFDDTNLPVLPGSSTAERGGTPVDSTRAGRRPLTPQERIEQLRRYREQLVLHRDQALVRARIFRQGVRFVS